MNDTITLQQLAQLADISVRTVRRYMQAGHLKPVLAKGDYLFFNISQVDEARNLWWGGKKRSDKRKTAPSGSTGKMRAAELAAARSRRLQALWLRKETIGLEDLL